MNVSVRCPATDTIEQIIVRGIVPTWRAK